MLVSGRVAFVLHLQLFFAKFHQAAHWWVEAAMPPVIFLGGDLDRGEARKGWIKIMKHVFLSCCFFHCNNLRDSRLSINW